MSLQLVMRITLSNIHNIGCKTIVKHNPKQNFESELLLLDFLSHLLYKLVDFMDIFLKVMLWENLVQVSDIFYIIYFLTSK